VNKRVLVEPKALRLTFEFCAPDSEPLAVAYVSTTDVRDRKQITSSMRLLAQGSLA